MPLFNTGNVTEINCWLSFKKPRQLQDRYLFVGLTSWVLESTCLCTKKSLLRTLENIVAHTSWWKVILLLCMPLTDNPRKLKLLRSLNGFCKHSQAGRSKRKLPIKPSLTLLLSFYCFLFLRVTLYRRQNVYSFLQKGSIYPLLCSYFFALMLSNFHWARREGKEVNRNKWCMVIPDSFLSWFASTVSWNEERHNMQ